MAGGLRTRVFLALLATQVVFVSWARAGLIGKPAPEIRNQVWINSQPLRLANLRGKVILLEFWTYG